MTSSCSLVSPDFSTRALDSVSPVRNFLEKDRRLSNCSLFIISITPFPFQFITVAGVGQVRQCQLKGGDCRGREEKAAGFYGELGADFSADRLDKKRHRQTGSVNSVWNLRFYSLPLDGWHYLSDRSNVMVISVVANATIIGVKMLFMKKPITAARRCSL